LSNWDVSPQLDFKPRTDVKEGKAGPGNWYTGANEIPTDDKEPIWIAKNYGPKWMNDKAGYHQIIAPLVMGSQTKNLFAQGHITMFPKPQGAVAPKIVSPEATAFMLEEGELAVTVEGFETAHLIDGDVVFVPPNTSFTYFAEAEFTKFLYVSGGGKGLDAILMKDAITWNPEF
jgi:glyoxylate utilization-related uncharacterized protein